MFGQRWKKLCHRPEGPICLLLKFGEWDQESFDLLQVDDTVQYALHV